VRGFRPHKNADEKPLDGNVAEAFSLENVVAMFV
jgi:hypothetical protein